MLPVCRGMAKWLAMSNKPSGRGFLGGVRVLDFTRVISGPYCTMMLADMGADVVKVEEPLHGDEMRGVIYKGRAPHHQDYFYTTNRSKRSITLNLKEARDRNIAQELAAKADIIIENYAPGVADRLGIGWKTLHERNPQLIYCSISGFGQTGPYRSRPALDPVVQALSGIMSVTGYEDQEPLHVGAPIADVVAGMFAAFAVACARFDVLRSRKGRYIDISMLEATVAVLGPRMGQALQAGSHPGRYGNGNPMRVPTNAYLTKDDRYLMICVLNDRHWKPFCEAMGRPEWFDQPQYKTMRGRVDHRSELDSLIAAEFRQRVASEWEERFGAYHIPYGLVNDYLQAIDDPQLLQRGIIKTIDHPVSGPIRVIGAPWKIEGLDVDAKSPPLLGEHTTEVLMDWLSLPPGEARGVSGAR